MFGGIADDSDKADTAIVELSEYLALDWEQCQLSPILHR